MRSVPVLAHSDLWVVTKTHQGFRLEWNGPPGESPPRAADVRINGRDRSDPIRMGEAVRVTLELGLRVVPGVDGGKMFRRAVDRAVSQ